MMRCYSIFLVLSFILAASSVMAAPPSDKNPKCAGIYRAIGQKTFSELKKIADSYSTDTLFEEDINDRIQLYQKAGHYYEQAGQYQDQYELIAQIFEVNVAHEKDLKNLEQEYRRFSTMAYYDIPFKKLVITAQDLKHCPKWDNIQAMSVVDYFMMQTVDNDDAEQSIQKQGLKPDAFEPSPNHY